MAHVVVSHNRALPLSQWKIARRLRIRRWTTDNWSWLASQNVVMRDGVAVRSITVSGVRIIEDVGGGFESAFHASMSGRTAAR